MGTADGKRLWLKQTGIEPMSLQWAPSATQILFATTVRGHHGISARAL